jgi:hypothetical protein
MVKIAFLISILFFVAPLSAEQIDYSEIKGTWRFVKKDFKKRHPYMLGFLVNKALRTRLSIEKKHFVQYIHPKKIYKEKRELIEIKKDNNKWLLSRKEGSVTVKFIFYKKNNNWYYKEGDMEYQVIKDSKEDYEAWLKGV